MTADLTAAAVLVAAGRGERLGADSPKAFVSLSGRPLLVRALEPFLAVEAIRAIVVVVPEGRRDEARTLLPDPSPVPLHVVVGGARRQDSVRLGLGAVPDDIEIVVVHDAARPLATPAIVRAVLEAAARHGGAIAATPVPDTVKEADGSGRITLTRARDGLWFAQTPQAFRREDLAEVHEQASRQGVEVTDDAALFERAGRPVLLVESSSENLKITTADDLRLAEAILDRRARSRG